MYKEKYLKYKSKYIALKNQLGGEIRQNVPTNTSTPIKWKRVPIEGTNPVKYHWVEDKDTSSTQIQDIKPVIKQVIKPVIKPVINKESQVIKEEIESDEYVEQQY
jgi:hypothetical protein